MERYIKCPHCHKEINLEEELKLDNDVFSGEINKKAEENLKAKSLKLFVEQFNLPKGLRISMANYRQEEWLINLPLYAIFIFNET